MQVQCPEAYEFWTGRANLPAGDPNIKSALQAMRQARAAGVWAMYEKDCEQLLAVVGPTLDGLLQHFVLDSLRIEEVKE